MTQDICIKISAPGKIILHGEHSVVYGKLAVAASLGLRTYIILKEQRTENGTKLLTINLKNLSLSLSFNIEDINKLLISFPKHSWNEPDLVDHESSLETIESFLKNSDRYPSLNNFHLISLKTILYLFTGILRSLDVLSESLDVTASTDLNIGAGTGSSASFNVGLAATFVQYLKEKLGVQPNKEEEMTTSGFTKSELEIISRWAFCAEKIIHGLPSGIDNTVCTFGNVVEFRKGTQPKLIELNSKLKVLLINTKVPRETKQLVLKVVKLRESDPIGTDKIMDELETIACEAIKNLLSLTDSSENKQYFDKLSQLCLENHKCLQQLGVSHPKLDEIVEMLSKYGLSGKLTGAGGGGYAISIIPSYIDGSIIDNLITTLEFCGFNAVLVDLGGIGVKIN